MEHIAHRSSPRRALASLQLAKQTRVGFLMFILFALMHNSQVHDNSPLASFSSLSLLGGWPCQLSHNKLVPHFAVIPCALISGFIRAGLYHKSTTVRPRRSRRQHSQAKLSRVRCMALHSDSHFHSFGSYFLCASTSQVDSSTQSVVTVVPDGKPCTCHSRIPFKVWTFPGSHLSHISLLYELLSTPSISQHDGQHRVLLATPQRHPRQRQRIHRCQHMQFMAAHPLGVHLQQQRRHHAGDDIQDFDTRWDHALLSASETPNDNVPEGLYRKIRESVQFQTVSAMYEQENDRDRAMPSCQ